MGNHDVVSPMHTTGNHESCHFQANFKPQSRQATQKEAGNHRRNNRDTMRETTDTTGGVPQVVTTKVVISRLISSHNPGNQFTKRL